MTCLTPKPSPKDFLCGLHQVQTLTPFDYAIWGVLENKTNATSHPNIGSLKTAFEEEWNKMSEEFILKACKSFRRRVDTIIEKKMAPTLNEFTVLCLSFLKIKINLVL